MVVRMGAVSGAPAAAAACHASPGTPPPPPCLPWASLPQPPPPQQDPDSCHSRAHPPCLAHHARTLQLGLRGWAQVWGLRGCCGVHKACGGAPSQVPDPPATLRAGWCTTPAGASRCSGRRSMKTRSRQRRQRKEGHYPRTFPWHCQTCPLLPSPLLPCCPPQPAAHLPPSFPVQPQAVVVHVEGGRRLTLSPPCRSPPSTPTPLPCHPLPPYPPTPCLKPRPRSPHPSPQSSLRTVVGVLSGPVTQRAATSSATWASATFPWTMVTSAPGPPPPTASAQGEDSVRGSACCHLVLAG